MTYQQFHSLDKYLIACYFQSTVPGTSYAMMHKVSAFRKWKLYMRGQTPDHKTINMNNLNKFYKDWGCPGDATVYAAWRMKEVEMDPVGTLSWTVKKENYSVLQKKKKMERA